ncbi:plasmid maintenance system killer protein [Burkholderia sp. 4701]|nr:plasmid maintenance system killer protein [Burkholderia sp. 4701]MXN80798.1 plasmid maintenance system killer protein [Burkholderia sp. 4812]
MLVMIRSFRCKDTQSLFAGESPRRFRTIESVATRKLEMIAAAKELRDLRSPPGNRLETLSGNRNGQYSIRINDRWRICFEWSDDGPANVEIIDYH